MGSDNPVSAENQQERLSSLGTAIGLGGGEGCFSTSGEPARADSPRRLQGQLRLDSACSESSEAIRRTSGTPDDEMVPSAWRHAGMPRKRQGVASARVRSRAGKAEAKFLVG